MFEQGDWGSAADWAVAPVDHSRLKHPVQALTAMVLVARQENAAAAQKVFTAVCAYRMGIAEDFDRLGEQAADRLGVGAEMEVALVLGVSVGTARKLISVGVTLDTRLPLVKAAFVAGELDFSRVRTIVDAVDGVSEATVSAVEAAIVDAALQRPPRALANEIARLLVAANPDDAAESRKKREKHSRTVKITPDSHGMAALFATMTAAEGVVVSTRIDEMAATVCRRDPRTPATLRTDAFVALINCETHLTCRCETADCPFAHLPAAEPATVHLHVHVDVETLLGFADNPANLEGHGPIDPDLARRFAQDATWQAIVEETRSRCPAKAHPAGFVPTATRLLPPPVPSGIGGAIADIKAAIDADPKVLDGEFPDGHGGLDEPPPGALSYRPRKEVKDKVYAKYSTCTFPNCYVPARKCQFDHIEPFDHSDPERGGWTIESNGHPACPHHHQAKTDGIFRVVRLAGDAIVWVSRNGAVGITIPEELGGSHEPEARKPVKLTRPAPAEDPPDDAIYDPTWWEQHMQSGDRPPTLADMAQLTDRRLAAIYRELGTHYEEHLAILAARDRHMPPPY